MIISFIISMIFLLAALRIMKQCCPYIINPVERWAIRGLKGIAKILWGKTERGGGTRGQRPHVRYRQ